MITVLANNYTGCKPCSSLNPDCIECWTFLTFDRTVPEVNHCSKCSGKLIVNPKDDTKCIKKTTINNEV